ncbi:MAG: extracellular solute-binding protein [Clostridiales bacterium]|nr:extracellular solute-binding protein [Clostridiales bacterium]
MTLEEYDEYMDEYNPVKEAVFNMQGELVTEIGRDEISTLYGAASDEEKNLYLLGYVHDENYTVNNIEIHVIDPQGNLKEQIILEDAPVEIPGMRGLTPAEEAEDMAQKGSKRDLDLFTPSLNYDPVKMQILKDGSILISKQGFMMIYDRTGEKRCSVIDRERDLEDNAFLVGEKYYVLSTAYDEDKGWNVQIKELNISNGALGAGRESVTLSGYYNPIVTGKGVFINSANGFLQYDFDSDSMNEVFNWNDTDVNRAVLSNVRCMPVSGDELNVVAFNDPRECPYLIHLTRAEKNPHAGKKNILVGGMYLSGDVDLLSFINQYNADPSKKIRVVIVDYTEDRDIFESSADTEKQLYLDILSGTGPDILVNMGNMEIFRNSRIMEDLNTYIDGENGIDRSLYFDNVLRACERDGKLYHVPVSFTLQGMAVNTDIISQTKGWTYDEFSQIAKDLPEEINILPTTMYNDLLKIMMGTSLSRFMNYQDQTVNFQNDEMKKILDLVRDYGVKEIPSYEAERVDVDYLESGSIIYRYVNYTDERIKAGMIAAEPVKILSIENIAVENKMFSGKAAFLGYPSFEGTGMAILPERTLGILSSGKNKDLAWDVIRSYLEYEKESTDSIVLPVNRARFENECRLKMEKNNKEYEEWVSENGIESLYKYDVMISKEEIDTLRDLVGNAGTAIFQDEAAFNVISEEAMGYFVGDRTAEDILANIQNRTNLIVTEV